MKNFRGTILFAIVVAIIGGFALTEFSKQKVEEEQKPTKDNLIQGLNSADVSELSYTAMGVQVYKLQNADGKWSLMAPVGDFADTEAVSSTLNSLASQQVEAVDIGTEAQPDWTKFGLNNPMGVFELKLLNGTAIKISIGSTRSYDNGYYLRKNEENVVYITGSGLDSVVQKVANEYRTKKFMLTDANLLGLKIKSDVKDHLSDVVLKKKEELWVSERYKSMQFDVNTVQDFLRSVKDFRMSDILADDKEPATLKKYKLQPGRIKIELAFEGEAGQPGKTEMIELSYPKDGDAALVASTNKAVYKVSKSLVDGLVKDLGYFRDKRFMFRFAADQIKKVEISQDKGKTKRVFEKNKEALWADALNQDNSILQADVADLLSGMQDLKADSFSADKSATAFSENAILFLDDKGEKVFSLNYGLAKAKEASASQYLAKTNVSEESFLISKSAIDNLTGKKFIEEKKPEEKMPEADKSQKADASAEAKPHE